MFELMKKQQIRGRNWDCTWVGKNLADDLINLSGKTNHPENVKYYGYLYNNKNRNTFTIYVQISSILFVRRLCKRVKKSSNFVKYSSIVQ